MEPQSNVTRPLSPEYKIIASFLLLLTLVQGFTRYYSREFIVVGSRMIPREYDPRGRLVEIFRKKTERAYFQLKGETFEHVAWPGLASLEWSLTWLRILASVYDEASIEGDFSWMFHKLRFVSSNLPAVGTQRDRFQTAMLPLFVVLGKDPAGALYLLNEKLSSTSTDYRVRYWAAMHALENLRNPKMAGFFFLEAAKLPDSPPYFAPLGFRLLYGADVINQDGLRKEFLSRINPELLDKIKKLRPEWFTN